MDSRDEVAGTPLAVAIGRLVSEHRRRIGLTRERLAQAGNVYGVTWGRTSIENIEKGRFSPTIQTLYVLSRALSDQATRRHRVELLDLLPTEGRIEIADGFSIPAVRLRSFLGGEEGGESVGDFLDEFERSLSGPIIPPSLSEKRAAKKLGVPVERLRDAAYELWSESLDAVVSQEAGPSASPQARGHATRVMVEELRSYIEGKGLGLRDG